MDGNIHKMREEIDLLDEEILNLISKRKQLSKKIIDLKIGSNLPVEDARREREIILNLHNKFSDKLSLNFIIRLFDNVFTEAKKQVKFGKLEAGKQQNIIDALNKRPLIIAGPCVIESQEQIHDIANILSKMEVKFLRGGVFKPRTSPKSFQGLGIEGLKYLNIAAHETNMYTVSEVLDSRQLEENYSNIDVIQIGTRNMTNFNLLKSIGKSTAADKKPVMLKRGFSSTINEFLSAAEYILDAGNPNVLLCLRGIRTFEQIDSTMRNTPDLADILELKQKTNLPVIFDPSHSAGNSNYIISLSKAALVLGADGLMIECHENPSEALSDGIQSIYPEKIIDIFEFAEKLIKRRDI